MARSACFAAVACFAACAPVDDDAAGEGEGEVDAVERVGCDSPVSGIALDSGLVEEEAGYDAALAALDVDGVSGVVSLAGVDGFFLRVVAWALDVAVDDLGGGLDSAALRETPMGRAVLASFLTEEADPLDFRFLRRGLHRFYACSRGLPATVDGFRTVAGVDDEDLAVVVLDDSRPKAGLRRRLSEDAARGVFIAETLNDDDTVRETEIVWSGQRNDGLLDFLVYDEHGVVSAASQFATNGGGTVNTAAPYTCLVCHVSDSGFDLVSPPR